ncbi:hypothetical protein [Planctomicrobium piriforme]|uniref:hypothetical protein n=1 Tax=Planctomicrobium piriforme TaxID=1576369 RepID=UPI0011141F39|nr:hypothetical protein [Planctomicrobium piriforme]
MTDVQALESRQLLSASPTLTNLGPTVTYNVDFNPVQIAPNASVWDADNDFNGSRLVVQMSNGRSYDQLVLAGGNGIGMNGSQVIVNGVEVGTAVIGYENNPLEVLFNANATGADVELVTRQVSFISYANWPAIEARNVTFQVFDGASNASAALTKKVAISDTPFLNSLGTSGNYRTGQEFTILGSSVSMVNAGDDYSGAKFIVKNTTVSAGDRLIIADIGPIDLDGNRILLNGAEVATFTGGNGGTPLTIQFGPGLTYAKVRGVLNNVAYTSTSGATALGQRVVSFQMIDGGGLASGVVNTSFLVLNNLSLSNPTPEPTFTAGGEFVYVASQASVTGSQAYLSGAKLEISLINVKTNDSVDLLARGGITIEGTDLFYQGTHIGTFERLFIPAQNANRGIIVTFDEGVTKAAVNSVLKTIAFKAYARGPVLTDRNISIVLRDTEGRASQPTGQTVHISNQPVIKPINSPPEYFYSAGASQFMLPTALIFDGGANYANSTFTAKVNSAKPGDELVILENYQLKLVGNDIVLRDVVIGTFTPSAGSTPLTINFNYNAREGDVQLVIQRIAYRNLSVSPNTAQRTLAFQFTDGTGAASSVLYKKVNYLT